MKITDEVFQVGGSEFTSHEDAAIYLINFDGHAALVDAGCGRSTERLFNNVQSCGVNVEYIEYLLIKTIAKTIIFFCVRGKVDKRYYRNTRTVKTPLAINIGLFGNV